MRRVFIPLEASEPSAPVAGTQSLTLTGASMGTSWHVQLLSDGKHEHAVLEAGIQAGIQRVLDQVVMQMSTWDPASDLCVYNRANAGSWQQLPGEFFKVVDYSLYLSQQTAGAFDITAGKLVDLWGFGPTGKRATAPEPSQIQTAMQAGNWKTLELDHIKHRLLQPGGIALDLSSIAKGFAVDQIARFLESLSISSYLIELGGELRGLGMKADMSPWWVAIESPGDMQASEPKKEYMVALHELSVATSGDYRQYFEQDGQRYAHTLDPRTGYPVANELASVTVLHPQCMVADALATALTVLGSEDGLAYANQHHIAALFLQRNGPHLEEKMSAALTAMLD
ncbi:FAD:protein FMN transferase [Undibacterium sp. Ji49W]|uniref:FAD:protein FMN transferase n=1 Tax=Undibacterium sp. Ji49W TaxID=3413040 RepID=UPI003BF3B56B